MHEREMSTTVNTGILEKLQQCIIDTMQQFTKEVVKAQGQRNFISEEESARPS